MRSFQFYLFILFFITVSAHSPHPLSSPFLKSTLSGNNQTQPTTPSYPSSAPLSDNRKQPTSPSSPPSAASSSNLTQLTTPPSPPSAPSGDNQNQLTTPSSPPSPPSSGNQTLLFAPSGSSRTLQSTPLGNNHHKGHKHVNTRRYFNYVPSNNDTSFTNQTLLAEEFVHTHNWVRRQYNLPPVGWDEKLATYARGYLMQRYEDCKLIHSSSNNYGENLFWGKKLHWTPSDAIYHWYQEKNWYDFMSLTCAPPPKQCGHFTQIVWRDTQRIGCALQHCQNRSAGMLIACEYDPAGNYQNENPLQHHA